jgi:hypothetical protein
VLTINESTQTVNFQVKNLLDESIDVELLFKDLSPYLDLSNSYINLYPGEERNITVTANYPRDDNTTAINAVLIKAFTIEERIPVQVDITIVPEKITPLWLKTAVGGFVVGLIGLLGYFGYTNRKQLSAWYKKKFDKKTSQDQVLQSISDYAQKEQAIAIKNMMQILKMEGVNDKDIRKSLIDQGFTEEEIQIALKTKTDDEKPATAPKK